MKVDERGSPIGRLACLTKKEVAGVIHQNSTALLPVKRVFDSSILSHLKKDGGYVPGPQIRLAVLSYIRERLPYQTVFDERDSSSFRIFPSSKHRVETFWGSSQGSSRQILTGANLDTDLYTEDIMRLKPPGWLSDNVINAVTTLISRMRGRTPTVYLFNCLATSQLMKRGKDDITDEERRRSYQGIVKNACRPGCDTTWDSSSIALAPLNIKEGGYEHWIGILMDKERKEVFILDSCKGAENYSYHDRGTHTARVLREIDARGWGYKGLVPNFPQQPNSYNCGIFILVAARMLSHGCKPTEISFSVDAGNSYRIRFAHELLVGSCS